jgi:hypothetical protein
VSERLGHSSVAFTMVYADVIPTNGPRRGGRDRDAARVTSGDALHAVVRVSDVGHTGEPDWQGDLSGACEPGLRWCE